MSGFAETLRQQAGVPGLSLAVTNSEGLIAIGHAGVREIGHKALVQPGDPFHIGSLTKSLTATLVGTFVENGTLGWESTITQLHPALAQEIPESARSITIAQLLSHRSGIRDDPRVGVVVAGMWGLTGTMPQQRRVVAEAALKRAENQGPGADFAYSNMGYVVVGHLLEHLTGQSWEELLEERVTSPLGLTTVGHGPPGVGEPSGSTPNGHAGTAEDWKSLPRGIAADNPPPFGPAGRVHMSTVDLATFAREHLRGLRGSDGLLKADTFKRIHSDTDSPGYALGWGISAGEGTRQSVHSGSNTRWLSFILVWPDSDVAFVIGMNAAPADAMQGGSMAATVRELIRLELIKQP